MAADVQGGSETHINDPNLKVILELIIRFLKIEGGRIMQLRTTPELVMSSGIISEGCVAIKNQLCLGSEAKGRYHSSAVPRAQSLSLGTEIAVRLLRSGVFFADCAVPIITCFGDGEFQILGVYLMEPSFPVLTRLSRTLDLFEDDDCYEIAQWILCLASFVEATARLLESCQVHSKKPMNSVCLRLSGNFFKPIYVDMKGLRGRTNPANSPKGFGYHSEIWLRVNSIMKIYQRLAHEEGSEQFILFPKGIMVLPNEDDESNKQNRARLIDSMEKFHFSNFLTNTPLMIYPLLGEEYNDGRPPQALVDDYLRAVKCAIAILNKAGVCHADLRPKNILWRRDDKGGIGIQIIDFEDAGLFGWPIRFFEGSRYPHSELPRESLIIAAAVHNQWFLESLGKWLMDTDGGLMDFDDYMLSPEKAEFVSQKLQLELDACVFPLSSPETRPDSSRDEVVSSRNLRKRKR